MAGAFLPRAYLLAYNLAQFCGWAAALYKLGDHVARTGSLEGTWAVAGQLVGERWPERAF